MGRQRRQLCGYTERSINATFTICLITKNNLITGYVSEFLIPEAVAEPLGDLHREDSSIDADGHEGGTDCCDTHMIVTVAPDSDLCVSRRRQSLSALNPKLSSRKQEFA